MSGRSSRSARSVTKSIRVPKYRLHKGSGQAAVTIDGKSEYLGKHGTIESHEKYRRLIGEYLAKQGQPIPAQKTLASLSLKRDKKPITVVVAGAKYLAWCREHRRNRVANVEGMLKIFVGMFQYELAANIGPLALKEVRKKMIAYENPDSGKKWSRRYVNDQIGCLRQMYGWLVENELLPAEVAEALRYVKGLRAGEEGAREKDPIGSVDDADVEKTLPHLPQVIADMVRLQRFTGMRPGEVCMLRPIDIDQTGDVWLFKPIKHKTQHRGKSRVILIGPQAQGILLRYLARDAESYCFSPADSESKRRVARGRGTKGKTYAPKYHPGVYRRAIHRAAETAGVSQWAPNQLRHTAATEIRKKFGLEAAQVLLGHSRADVTQIYAERDISKGVEVARLIG